MSDEEEYEEEEEVEESEAAEAPAAEPEAPAEEEYVFIAFVFFWTKNDYETSGKLLKLKRLNQLQSRKRSPSPVLHLKRRSHLQSWLRPNRYDNFEQIWNVEEEEFYKEI